jgi:HEPN domain-containing protein
MELEEILNNIRQKYADAVLLKEHGRYANSIYLSGYCVELSLKYAIAKHMNWTQFNTEGKFRFLKVHDLELLVSLTGREVHIKKMSAWQVANKWNESKRYDDPAKATRSDADSMLFAVNKLVEDLCAISLQK